MDPLMNKWSYDPFPQKMHTHKNAHLHFSIQYMKLRDPIKNLSVIP